ncbi:MAG: hypothetical protein AB7N71_12095, partial [Phycisphaerae bacterium]
MSVAFLIGRAGTGKTETCLQQVAEALRDLDPTRPSAEQSRPILLVPEQASLQMEAALLHRLPVHGFTGGVVFSFTTLAKQILADAGFRGEFVGETARLMGVRALLMRKELQAAFGKAVETNGFLREVQRTLRELMQEDVTPDQLRAGAALLASPDDRKRVVALADLFDAYQDWLGAEKFDIAAEIGVA